VRRPNDDTGVLFPNGGCAAHAMHPKGRLGGARTIMMGASGVRSALALVWPLGRVQIKYKTLSRARIYFGTVKGSADLVSP
jgi:hypothetical protein